MSEDKQVAVGISVTLSGQLIAAALGMIAVVGALATFLVDKRIVNWLFWVSIVGCFVCFVTSIVAGGKGVTAARDKGFEGDWRISVSKDWFDGQAKCCLGGLVFLAIALLNSCEPQKDRTLEVLAAETSKMGAIETKMTELAAQQKDTDNKLAQLGQALGARQDAFESELEKHRPMLERLEKEQRHLEVIEELQKTVTELQKGQGTLSNAITDLKTQIDKAKKKK